jgi:hypothetical protein
VSGAKSGEFHVPPVGATVWCSFWGGHAEKPIWTGGWFTPDMVPELAGTSYDPTPQTRIVRTENGHTFEMRWKKDQSEIHLDTEGKQVLRLVDSDALGGPRIELSTESGFKLLIDQKTKKVTIVTPGGRSIVADDDAQKITVTTTKHTVTLDDAGSKATVDTTGDIEVNATGDIDINATQNLTGVATVDAELDGVNVSLVASALAKLVGAQVTIGSDGGAHFKLMDERLITLLNVMIATYNGHTHIGTPVTSPPLAPQIPVVLDSANTIIAKGN